MVKVIDWEHSAIGSRYIDYGTLYLYAIKYSNIKDLFYQYKDIQFPLVEFFAVFRVLKLLSFIDLKTYKKADKNTEFSFAGVIKNLKKILYLRNLKDVDMSKTVENTLTQNLSNNTRVKVCIVVKNSNGNFLLLQRKPDEIYPNIWESAGGKHEGKESLKDCVIRELKEETGLVANDNEIKPLFKNSFYEDFSQKTVTVFYYLVEQDKNPLYTPEHTRYKWFTKKEALKLVPFEGPKIALKIN